jgi:hypothetical protein
MFNGKTHYKWPFSIAMLVYQRVLSDAIFMFLGHDMFHFFCAHPDRPVSHGLFLAPMLDSTNISNAPPKMDDNEYQQANKISEKDGA